jgi:hypothetical protein
MLHPYDQYEQATSTTQTGGRCPAVEFSVVAGCIPNHVLEFVGMLACNLPGLLGSMARLCKTCLLA